MNLGEITTMTASATTTKTSTWQLDAAHSSVEFSVKHLMIATVKGSFTGIQGAISGDESDLSQAQLTVTIDAASVNTRNEQRDGHLRSADFFDVEKYPTITFAAKRISGDVTGDFKVTGDLTVHGVTREITLDGSFEGHAKDPWGKSRLVYTASGKIRRSDFGLTWNQALETGGVVVSDDVKINVEVQFVRD
jgi:polyisoprenoid-binding protein YceI